MAVVQALDLQKACGMKLILIEGANGTGKTVLAQQLLADLHCRGFIKDAYKERRYDELGSRPTLRQWRAIEKDSWQELYKMIKAMRNTDTLLIIEGDFRRKQYQKITQLMQGNPIAIEVFCFARGLLPFWRFVQRNRTGERHRGHLDYLGYGAVFAGTILTQLGWHLFGPFGAPENLIEFDTTMFSSIHYRKLKQYITQRLDRCGIMGA